MNILRKYARPKPAYDSTEKKTLSVRIPKDLYEQFREECERNGYSMSEGIRLLLEVELRGEPAEHFTTPSPAQEYKLSTNPMIITERKPRQRTSNGGNKKNANRWKVGNKLPCPKCGKWGAAGNFKRDHIDAHGLDYPDAPSFLEAHAEEADQMVEEYKRQLGLLG